MNQTNDEKIIMVGNTTVKVVSIYNGTKTLYEVLSSLVKREMENNTVEKK
jgi:hypothetical protein